MSVFDDLVGQPGVVQTLEEAAEAAARATRGEADTGAMTHAWLFTGPPGSGRSVAARALAAALQCVAPPEQRRGCGVCAGCQQVLAGTHPDVRAVVPAGLHLLIDDAREMVRLSGRAPLLGGWQVTVVEDADRMEERTSNTVLKALEEPPPRGVLLLCAPTVEDLLPTIRSRCRLVSLRTPTAGAVAEVLARRDGVDVAMAHFAARAAQGHVGRARRLACDEDARRERREVLTVPRSLGTVGQCLQAAATLVAAAREESERLTSDVDERETAALSEALGAGATGKGVAVARTRGSAGALRDLEARQKSRGTRSQRDALDRALIDLAAYYRDMLAVQLGAQVDAVHVDVSDSVAAGARGSPPESTLRRIEAVLACREAVDANVAPLLAVESMALALSAG